MKYFKVKETLFSRIFLGGSDFGTTVSKETSFELMDLYIKNGGNTIDTGRVYCDWIENGSNKSESTIGEYIESRGIRDKVIISTKGGHPRLDSMDKPRLHKEEIESDLNESLHYLKTSYIDIYFLHRDDENIEVEYIMDYMNEFYREGKIRFIGVSNWKKDRVIKANEYANKNNLEPIRFNQIMHSYAKINREAMPDQTQVCMSDIEFNSYFNELKDVKVVGYTSQAQGLFSIAKEKGIDNLSPRHKALYLNEETLKKIDEVNHLSIDYNISPTATALGLLLNEEIKPFALIGGYNKEFLLDSLESINIVK